MTFLFKKNKPKLNVFGRDSPFIHVNCLSETARGGGGVEKPLLSDSKENYQRRDKLLVFVFSRAWLFDLRKCLMKQLLWLWFTIWCNVCSFLHAQWSWWGSAEKCIMNFTPTLMIDDTQHDVHHLSPHHHSEILHQSKVQRGKFL